jgi:hypothetical protein
MRSMRCSGTAVGEVTEKSCVFANERVPISGWRDVGRWCVAVVGGGPELDATRPPPFAERRCGERGGPKSARRNPIPRLRFNDD